MTLLIILRQLTGKESVTFDTIMREGHEGSVSITTHPVEVGADVADHIRIGLDKLSFEGFVSSTPIKPPFTQMDGITGSVSPMALDMPNRIDVSQDWVQLDVPAPPLHLPVAVPLVGTIAAVAGIAGPKPVVPAQVLHYKQGAPPSIKASVLNFTGDVLRPENVYAALREIYTTGELITVITSVRTYTSMAIEHLGTLRESGVSGALTFNLDITEVRTVQTKTVAAPKNLNAKPKNNAGNQPAKEDSDPAAKQSTLHRLIHGGP